MKRLKYLFVLFPLFLNAEGLLNDLKKQELRYDRLKTVQESQETAKSWINPVTLQYSYTKDNMTGTVATTKLLSVSVNQPVFKSGAIYYSIKYAGHSKEFNLLSLELQKRELIKKALELAYDYKIVKLNEQIIALNIKNAKIDIKKKKEEFLNGVGDSAFLNNAVLNLNSLKLSLEDLRTNAHSLKFAFNNISSLDIDKIKFPVFKLISKKEFINSNMDLFLQEKFKKVKYDLYKMQKGNQLLSVNFNASLNRQSIDYENNSPQLQDSSTDYYRVGLSVVMPLSFNAVNKIEQAKIDYLKSETLLEDKKSELLNTYKTVLYELKTYDSKIKIYRQNIKIYDELINSAKESLKAGNATEYDLEILQNSRKTMFLNIEILKLQKQKLLLSLYYKLSGWKY
ncbi:TolC family protein [Nautilia sp.]